MIKPNKLQKGDRIATVSLSWGGAGDIGVIERYKIAKKRIEKDFGLEVISMPNSLKGSDYLYNNPKARAQDMMQAFSDKSIKGIFSNIGGEETIRLLPYIDIDIIKNNSKIFLGYSDTTVNHFMCYKAGLTSFYGPSLLDNFAENIQMHDYTVQWIKKVLFSNSIVGEIKPSKYWTSDRGDWTNPSENKTISKRTANSGYELLQGTGIVRGQLLGGCGGVLETLKGTPLWPSLNKWNNKILFFETSGEKPTPSSIKYWLRNYGAIGILDVIKGIIIGKPVDETYYEEYKLEFLKVIRDEFGRSDLPILYNVNFGHTSPLCILPYGIDAEIDCDNKTFILLDSGVV